MKKKLKITNCVASLLFVGSLQVYAASEVRLQLNFKNATLMEVLDEIEHQTGYSVLIQTNDLDTKKKISVSSRDESVDKVLSRVLSRFALAHEIRDNHVVIVAKSQANTLKEYQQNNKKTKVSGVVADQSGEPIIGANIIIKGTDQGTISDLDGAFSLELSSGDQLEISYIGYTTQRLNYKSQKSLDVVLLEDTKTLEEVVVVGYGTQKKVNLTGSVSTVNTKDLDARPQSNVQNMLQGKVAGLQIVSNTGQPGRDSGSMTIRGKGSFGASSAPLVLIDGIVGSMSTLAPDDIESISVLKDAASASIYGSRAANGVILVTTKKGVQGKAQISYSFNYGWQKATRLTDQIWDSATYMDLFNQMADRMGGRTKYPQDLINKYKDPNKDKNLYPDYNWMDETFKTGSIMTHNLSVNGGTEKVTYNISGSYLNQDGILPNHGYKRYTVTANMEAQVHNRVKVGMNTSMYNGKINEPYYTNDGLILMILQQRPMTKPYLPDGSGRYSYANTPTNIGGEWLNRNPIWAMNETSRYLENWIANGQLYAIVDILKKDNMHLLWNTKGAFKYSDQFRRSHYPANPEGYYYLKESDYINGGKDEHLLATDFFPEKGVSNNDNRDFYRMFYTTLDYTLALDGKHDISALFGFQEEALSARFLSGFRENYPSDSMTEINGGSTSGQSLSGGVSEYTLRSFFGRVTYAYLSKYLLEANFRCDGTSRIHKDHRWGVFPSFSGAWRISEEAFMKDKTDIFDNLKLRASWGKLGNSEIGYYPYQEVYQTAGYVFDGAIQQGVVQNSLKDRSLRWESTTSTTLGLDMSLAKGLFSFTFEWYKKITDGILSQASIPMSVGMGAPTINYGKLQNTGIEFDVRHQNNIADFKYGAGFLANINENEVLKLKSPSYGAYIYEEGKPYGEHYLYVWDGLFQSEEDIELSPKHPNNPKPGDLKFKDVNNDGVIDAKDRTMVRGVYPKILYSFDFNFGYKDFDLSVFFQGVGRRKIWTDFFGDAPFAQGAPPSTRFLEAWTPENTNTNVPALYVHGYAPVTGLRSTYNLKDASYLRLKNIQLGYNVPKNILNKCGVNFLRFYLSAENLFTFTDYPDFDPERGGDGWHAQYPHLKTINFGLNLKF